MPERNPVSCEQIPAPFGHYSQAIKIENSMYVSAIYPVDAKTGKLVGPDPDQQCELVFNHLATLLQFSGAQLSNILMLRIYMTHFEDLKIIEKVSKAQFYFVPPARTLVPVPWLPYGARLALDAYVQVVPPQAQGGMLY